jgi:acyl dehydratase
MAIDTVRLAEGRDISVEKFRKVRFKRVIRPGERLKIIVTPKKIEEGSYAFRILAENELACNGVLFVRDPHTANSKEETP